MVFFSAYFLTKTTQILKAIATTPGSIISRTTLRIVADWEVVTSAKMHRDKMPTNSIDVNPTTMHFCIVYVLSLTFFRWMQYAAIADVTIIQATINKEQKQACRERSRAKIRRQSKAQMLIAKFFIFFFVLLNSISAWICSEYVSLASSAVFQESIFDCSLNINCIIIQSTLTVQILFREMRLACIKQPKNSNYFSFEPARVSMRNNLATSSQQQMPQVKLQKNLPLSHVQERRKLFALQSIKPGYSLDKSSPPTLFSEPSTHPILITQLQMKADQLRNAEMTIQALQQRNQQTNAKLKDLTSVIYSFYTKGAPVQSELAKDIFQGSYPTLIQQADSMRTKLAQSNQQIRRLKEEKAKSRSQAEQIEWMLRWHGNRIRDLENNLSEAYANIDQSKSVKQRIMAIEKQNFELHKKILEYQGSNYRISQQNNKLKSLVGALASKHRKDQIMNQSKINTNPFQLQSQSPIKNKQNVVNSSSSLISQNHIQDNKGEPVKPENVPQSPFQNKFMLQKQEQLLLMNRRLVLLKQQNDQLQAQHQHLLNRSKTRLFPEVSLLDQRQRIPYEQTKSITTNETLDRSIEAINRLKKEGSMEVGQIEKRIEMLRTENKKIYKSKP